MANIVSCPVCAAVVVPGEAGAICPQCRRPLLHTEVRIAREVLSNAPLTLNLPSSGQPLFGRLLRTD